MPTPTGLPSPQDAPIVTDMTGRKLFVTSDTDTEAEGNIDPLNLPTPTVTQTALDQKARSVDVDPNLAYERYFTGQSGLGAIRAMLDAEKSCGMVVIGDSTGDSNTIAWPRKFADLVATNYPNHRVVMQDVVQSASKGYTKIEIQAAPNGERYMEWRPETPNAWATSTVHSVGDWVGAAHPSAAYICTAAHTSGADDDEPGTGANWENYWKKSTNCSSIIWPSEDVDFFHGDNTIESTEAFELTVDFILPTTQTAQESLFAKRSAVGIERGARIDITSGGTPIFYWQADKASSSLSSAYATASITTNVARGVRHLLRVRFDPDNGANRVIQFHTSIDDGANWAQLGSTVTGASTQWAKTPGFINLGSSGASATSGFWGLKSYGFTLREGVAGTGRILANPPVDTASWASNISNPILQGSPVFEIQNFSWSGKRTEHMTGDKALTGTTFIDASDFEPKNVVCALVNLSHNDNPNATNYFAGKNWTEGLKIISTFIQDQCPFSTVGVIGQNPKNNGSEYDKQHTLRIAYGLSEVPKNGDGFCNIYQAFIDHGKVSLVADGTHPNEEGYEFWADLLWKASKLGH